MASMAASELTRLDENLAQVVIGCGNQPGRLDGQLNGDRCVGLRHRVALLAPGGSVPLS